MAGLHFDITGDNTDFMNKLRQTENGIKNTSKSIEQSGMSIEAVFGKLSKAAAGIGLAFSAQQFIGQMAMVRGEFQQLEVAFETMLGSTEKASALMAQITKTAAVTPFGLQDVAGGAKQLLAYGVASEKVNETLIRLGDIAAGLSIPLNDLVYLYGTTMTQGRMFTQDLRQFQGRGIPLADELAKQFGVTKDAVGELVTAGKVGFAEMEQAIVSMTSEGGKFGGLMEAQSKTITGQISNIEDAIDQMFNELGKSSEGVINLTLSGVSAIVENYELVGKALMGVVTTYGAYRAAVIANIALTRSWAVAARADAVAKAIQTAATKAQTIATIALNTALKANPFVLVATGVVALGTAMWALSDGTTTAERAMIDFNAEQDKLTAKEQEQKKALQGLIDVLKDENAAEAQRFTALQMLQDLYPEIRQQFVDEKGHIQNITGLWEMYEGQVKSARKETLTSAISTINESLQKVQEDIKAAKGGTNIAALRILEKREERLKEDLKNNQKALDELNKQNEGGSSSEGSKPKNKEYWEEQKKNAEKMRNALDIHEVNSKDWKKYTAQIIEADKQLAKYKSPSSTTKDAEKRAKEEQKITEAILSMTRQSQQDEINLMKEGSEKKIAQINHNYQKEIDAVKSQRQEWEDNQNGKLTKEQEEVLNKQKFNAEKTREKELADLKEKNLRDELQALYDYLQEYGTIQQQKYAIAKEYDMKIAKEQNDTRKKMLEKEKRTKLVSLDSNNLAMGIDWGTAFEGVGTVLQGIAKETLKKVEEYIKTEEFKGLKAEDKKTYTELREKLRKETGEGAASPFNFKQWGVIANQVRDYQKSVEAAKNAQEAHTLALKNLEEAEENLKNATTDTAKAIAKEKVKIAQGVVDSTASGQSEAEDKMNESKDNLTTSTNEAAQGISNFASYLNEMSNGSLYGFANGITKLITSLGKGSDGVGKSLEALGGKIGGIIGAILQILDALGDDPAKFIDDLLRNVANAIEAILTDLPKIIGSVVKGVGNIVGSVFTGIASWFGFGKGDRKKENRIKEYQKQIDGLEKTYQRLEKEVDALYSNVAKAKIEAQNENLKQQKALIQKQISEEEKKKKTDNDKIAEWKEQIESIDETIKENREAAKDAIFGSDIQSAIEDFASAYVDAWSAGEDKAKSAKDMVKTMIKNMITESIKAAASDPMKAIREKLLAFWSDEYISGWEQDYLNKMATDLQKELDSKFGWADNIFDDSVYSQEASSKGMETMTQDQASELNGRFTALQMAGEEIKNQMIQSVVIMTQMLGLSSQNNGILNDILTQNAISNGYLADLVKYSKTMATYGEKIDKIVQNTQNM